MLRKITFALLLCMVVYYQPAATKPAMDENAIGELVLNNFYSVMNATGTLTDLLSLACRNTLNCRTDGWALPSQNCFGR